jgi:ferrochelatase
VVQPYYRHNAYLEALEYSMVPYLEQHYDHLLFSYHGVPERHIRKGDVTGSHCLSTAGCCDIPSAAHAKCYRHQCMTTTAMVAARLGIPKHKFSVSFQSRLGRDPWLQPYTAKRLEQMPGEGINKLLVVCPAFVSDCLETLEEIAEEGKEIFMHAGGESFTMIPCLNAHPLWINAITQLVEEV